MAVSQPARDDVRVEGIAEWMERRRREVAARRREVELAGRAEWVAAGPGQASWPTARTQVQPVAYQPSQGARSATPAPTARPRTVQEDEMTRLRREQASFKEVVREESRRNSWMAIPALAPLAVPILAEGGRPAHWSARRAPVQSIAAELPAAGTHFGAQAASGSSRSGSKAVNQASGGGRRECNTQGSSRTVRPRLWRSGE